MTILRVSHIPKQENHAQKCARKKQKRTSFSDLETAALQHIAKREMLTTGHHSNFTMEHKKHD